jgi:hypothetical protein
MFHNPTFIFLDDEGIYTEQAWAVIQMHRLAPYTYFYDHAPGGWVLLGAWMWITGGVHSFGNAIDSGRVLMLLLNIASIALVFRVARKFGCRPASAAIGALILCLSPLAIFYQRMVLLDSIMLFWALLSLDLLLDGWGRLSRLVLSGVCFGLALVSKETAIFLLPPMLYIAILQRWRHQGRFAVAGWVVPMLIVSSWYLLYALLKGELLPSLGPAGFVTSGDSIAGGSGSRVSLLGSLFWQMSRGGGGILNLRNEFWQLLRSDWLMRDRLSLSRERLPPRSTCFAERGIGEPSPQACWLRCPSSISRVAAWCSTTTYCSSCPSSASILRSCSTRSPLVFRPWRLHS